MSYLQRSFSPFAGRSGFIFLSVILDFTAVFAHQLIKRITGQEVDHVQFIFVRLQKLLFFAIVHFFFLDLHVQHFRAIDPDVSFDAAIFALNAGTNVAVVVKPLLAVRAIFFV